MRYKHIRWANEALYATFWVALVAGVVLVQHPLPSAIAFTVVAATMFTLAATYRYEDRCRAREREEREHARQRQDLLNLALTNYQLLLERINELPRTTP